MNGSIWLALLLIWPLNAYDTIGQNNLARRQAEEAYRRGDFSRAVAGFQYLSRQPGQKEQTVWLNLGHAYFSLGNYREAKRAYRRFIPAASGGPVVGVAYTQLGVLACIGRDTSQALQLFRSALVTDPENEPARFNFELVKARFSGRQPPRSRSKRRPKPTSQPRDPEVARSPRQEEILRRLRALNMTEEQASQLLNAMQQDDLPLELARRQSAGAKKNAGAGRW